MCAAAGPTIVIADAVPDDAPAVAAVHLATWRHAYRGQLPDAFLDGLSLESWTESRRRMLEQPTDGTRTRTLRVAGELAGFAAFGPARDADLPPEAGEVYAIYLHPSYWDRRLGLRLFEDAVELLVSGGREPCVLWVLETNARARRFYERSGWRPDGARKDEQRPGATFREVRYRDTCTPMHTIL